MVTQAMLGPILQLPDSYSTGQEPAPLLPASPSCCRNCPAWNNSRHRISVAAIAGRTGSWPQRAKRPPQCWGSTASAGGGNMQALRPRPAFGRDSASHNPANVASGRRQTVFRSTSPWAGSSAPGPLFGRAGGEWVRWVRGYPNGGCRTAGSHRFGGAAHQRDRARPD